MELEKRLRSDGIDGPVPEQRPASASNFPASAMSPWPNGVPGVELGRPAAIRGWSAPRYEPSQVAWFDHPGRHGLPNGTGAFKQELQEFWGGGAKGGQGHRVSWRRCPLRWSF